MKNFYSTKDQQIASVLLALRERLLTVEWRNNECHFIFENKILCEEKAMQHLTNQLSVNSKTLFDALKTIKTIIHQN